MELYCYSFQKITLIQATVMFSKAYSYHVLQTEKMADWLLCRKTLLKYYSVYTKALLDIIDFRVRLWPTQFSIELFFKLSGAKENQARA